jgi:hypothetical protein
MPNMDEIYELTIRILIYGCRLNLLKEQND